MCDFVALCSMLGATRESWQCAYGILECMYSITAARNQTRGRPFPVLNSGFVFHLQAIAS